MPVDRRGALLNSSRVRRQRDLRPSADRGRAGGGIRLPLEQVSTGPQGQGLVLPRIRTSRLGTEFEAPMSIERLHRLMTDGPTRFRIGEEPDETPENVPEDVRHYVEVYDDADVFALAQGDDRIVIAIEQWERFCVEATAALVHLRQLIASDSRDGPAPTACRSQAESRASCDLWTSTPVAPSRRAL